VFSNLTAIAIQSTQEHFSHYSLDNATKAPEYWRFGRARHRFSARPLDNLQGAPNHKPIAKLSTNPTISYLNLPVWSDFFVKLKC